MLWANTVHMILVQQSHVHIGTQSCLVSALSRKSLAIIYTTFVFCKGSHFLLLCDMSGAHACSLHVWPCALANRSQTKLVLKKNKLYSMSLSQPSTMYLFIFFIQKWVQAKDVRGSIQAVPVHRYKNMKIHKCFKLWEEFPWCPHHWTLKTSLGRLIQLLLSYNCLMGRVGHLRGEK